MPIIQLATCSLATEQATHTAQQNASERLKLFQYLNPSYESRSKPEKKEQLGVDYSQFFGKS